MTAENEVTVESDGLISPTFSGTSSAEVPEAVAAAQLAETQKLAKESGYKEPIDVRSGSYVFGEVVRADNSPSQAFDAAAEAAAQVSDANAAEVGR